MQIERPDSPLAPATKSVPEPENASGCFVRVAWLASNVALIALAATIAREKPGALSVTSGVFWGTVGLAIGLHYVEVTRLRANTLAGKPATMASWRRYSLGLLAVAGLLWGALIALA
jgi:hypothetical protein